MPWSLILIVAGIVVYAVSSYNTLGVVLIAIGGGLLLLQLLFFGLFVKTFKRKAKRFDRDFDNFFK